MVYSQAFVHSNSLKQFGVSKVSSNLQLGKTSTVHLAVLRPDDCTHVYFLNSFDSADTQGTQCGCHCLGCHGNRSSDAPCTCEVKWLPGAQPMRAAVVWRLRLRDEWIIVRNGKNVLKCIDSETLRSMGRSMNKFRNDHEISASGCTFTQTVNLKLVDWRQYFCAQATKKFQRKSLRVCKPQSCCLPGRNQPEYRPPMWEPSGKSWHTRLIGMDKWKMQDGEMRKTRRTYKILFLIDFSDPWLSWFVTVFKRCLLSNPTDRRGLGVVHCTDQKWPSCHTTASAARKVEMSLMCFLGTFDPQQKVGFLVPGHNLFTVCLVMLAC